MGRRLMPNFRLRFRNSRLLNRMTKHSLRRTPYRIRDRLLPNALNGKCTYARPTSSVHRDFIRHFLLREKQCKGPLLPIHIRRNRFRQSSITDMLGQKRRCIRPFTLRLYHPHRRNVLQRGSVSHLRKFRRP